MRLTTVLSLLALGAGAIACAASPADDSPQLTVAAAASTQEVMQAIQTAYQAEAPVAITYSFGSSGSLAQQIAQGAPVDVFLSASPQWMDELETQGLVKAPQALLQNAMVLVTPLAKVGVSSFEDLATDAVARVAVGEPESVPAGRYARETLTAMALWEALTPKLVFGKSARQVLAYVETGNVDAGLVYATDVLASEQVKAIATASAETHSPIVYPVAVVVGSGARQPEVAQDFVDFLVTEAAADIFRAHGFELAH